MIKQEKVLRKYSDLTLIERQLVESLLSSRLVIESLVSCSSLIVFSLEDRWNKFLRGFDIKEYQDINGVQRLMINFDVVRASTDSQCAKMLYSITSDIVKNENSIKLLYARTHVSDPTFEEYCVERWCKAKDGNAPIHCFEMFTQDGRAMKDFQQGNYNSIISCYDFSLFPHLNSGEWDIIYKLIRSGQERVENNYKLYQGGFQVREEIIEKSGNSYVFKH